MTLVTVSAAFHRFLCIVKTKNTMQNFISKYKSYIIGAILGAVAGFLYWKFVGCSSGSCPITSRWYNSTLYGLLIGALLGSSSKKKVVEKEEDINS